MSPGPPRSVRRAVRTGHVRVRGCHRPSCGDPQQLQRIGLRFHDLRHEAGSRLIEAGWPAHHVQEMLGHANLSQTSTYLNIGRLGLQESMRKYTDEPSARCNPVANETPTEHPPGSNAVDGPAEKVLVN